MELHNHPGTLPQSKPFLLNGPHTSSFRSDTLGGSGLKRHIRIVNEIGLLAKPKELSF